MTIRIGGYRTLIEALDAAPRERLFVLEWHDETDHRSVTFGEFQDHSTAWASFLRERGAASGDQVALLMKQGVSLMAAFAGAMRIGALPAILAYPSAKVEENKYRSGLRGISSNLQAPLIVVDEAFPETFVPELATNSTKIVRSTALHLRSAPSLNLPSGSSQQKRSAEHPPRQHGGVATAQPQGATSPQSRAAMSLLPRAATSPELRTATLPKHDASHSAAPVDLDSLAFVQHSSGTTGLQKGVALSHGAVLRQLSHLAEVLQISESDKLYSWLPLYHDMGLIACFLLPMVCHLPVVMQTPTEWVQRPATMLELNRQHRCTLAWMPNFAFQFIPRRTTAEERARCDLSSLRALINCSEPVRAQSFDEFYAAFAAHGLRQDALQSSYAMAENVFAVTQSGRTQNGAGAVSQEALRTRADAALEDSSHIRVGAASQKPSRICDDAVWEGPLRICADGQRFRYEGVVEEVAAATPGAVTLISSGRPLTQNHVRIFSDSGEMLPECRVGEILIKSDSLFAGYHKRPELTAEAMTDGWYRTGDLGFLWREELFVVGRKKDLLIIGGENIYPQDVEEAVCAHPAIHDGRAVAMGLFNAELGTEDLAVVAEVEREELLARKAQIEREIRAAVLAQVGVAVRFLFLKPPMWIVKSTAGKASRSGTRDKLLREHTELVSRDASL